MADDGVGECLPQPGNDQDEPEPESTQPQADIAHQPDEYPGDVKEGDRDDSTGAVSG